MSKKNESNIRFYDPTKLVSQEEADGASFISLLLCSAGMFMRNKLIIWLAIFFIISTFCRRKNGTSIVHYLINLVMIIFGLVTTYMMHPPGYAHSWFRYLYNTTCGLSKQLIAYGMQPKILYPIIDLPHAVFLMILLILPKKSSPQQNSMNCQQWPTIFNLSSKSSILRSTVSECSNTVSMKPAEI